MTLNKIKKDMIDGLPEDLSGLNEQLAQKVQKVVGKGLSTNDYDNTEKAEVAKVKDKADKTYVDSNISTLDTKINSQASGSPKGTYATATDLTNAFPTGNTNIYVVTADGKWYYWNGTTWIAGGVYQSTGIPNEYLELKKLKGTATGKNLFDLETRTVGKYIDSSTLTIIDSGLYDTSDYIPVTVGESYTTNNARSIGHFDENFTMISATNNSNSTKLTFVATQPYVRITIHNTNVSTSQFEKGTVATSYESYKRLLTGEMIQDKAITSQKIGDKEITKEKLEFTIIGKNKFNKDVATSGYLDPTTFVLSASSNYVVSEFIPVEIGTTYALSGIRSIVYYDSSKTAVSGISNGENAPITITPQQPYIRVAVHNTLVSTAQIEIGNTPTEYQPFGYVIPLELIEEFDIGGTAYNQSLNTTDNVEFASVKTNGILPTGTLVSPPSGLVSGDIWADTTDSTLHPILRVMI